MSMCMCMCMWRGGPAPPSCQQERCEEEMVSRLRRPQAEMGPYRRLGPSARPFPPPRRGRRPAEGRTPATRRRVRAAAYPPHTQV
eukprot:CAMPEP_0185296372 /NCGR_PEP_ID=MMETSP1363-20130426/9065_1 /TAXON_ID=38817 /ORGANISM="Gephyrocapsa oceanica, Strain RCC1303" /LENGTH=84 /DNA_ID=CAMNT_0027893023 /DNA_START=51 /DNA_END=305 /DNA_ORIENTATION=-